MKLYNKKELIEGRKEFIYMNCETYVNYVEENEHYTERDEEQNKYIFDAQGRLIYREMNELDEGYYYIYKDNLIYILHEDDYNEEYSVYDKTTNVMYDINSKDGYNDPVFYIHKERCECHIDYIKPNNKEILWDFEKIEDWRNIGFYKNYIRENYYREIEGENSDRIIFDKDNRIIYRDHMEFYNSFYYIYDGDIIYVCRFRTGWRNDYIFYKYDKTNAIVEAYDAGYRYEYDRHLLKDLFKINDREWLGEKQYMSVF